MAGSMTKPTVAFFGATGGCAGNTLALTLKAGYTAHALARTPAKLTNQMSGTYSVPQASINSCLTVIEGSVFDANAVRDVLLINGKPADIIIFGIGAAPTFQASLRQPVTVDNPHVCATGMQAVVDAADELKCSMAGETGKETKPLVVAISTTGISRKKDDVPIILGPLYHWVLATPHVDKRAMEDILASAAIGSQGQSKKPFGGAVAIRPTLLADGEPKGVEKVNVGWEGIGEDSTEGTEPAKGYTIRRADVGAWIFSEIIEKNTRMQWSGRAVSLAY